MLASGVTVRRIIPFPEYSLGVVRDTCRARGRLLGDVRHTLSLLDEASRTASRTVESA